MKKLFFTLAICLFSLGAFASNELPDDFRNTINVAENLNQIPEDLIGCTVKVTTTYTINFGTGGTVVIKIVTIEPC